MDFWVKYVSKTHILVVWFLGLLLHALLLFIFMSERLELGDIIFMAVDIPLLIFNN
jgi:hypothetical protein